MVYEKEDLLIDGTGKYHDYNFTGLPAKVLLARAKEKPKTRRPH